MIFYFKFLLLVISFRKLYFQWLDMLQFEWMNNIYDVHLKTKKSAQELAIHPPRRKRVMRVHFAPPPLPPPLHTHTQSSWYAGSCRTVRVMWSRFLSRSPRPQQLRSGLSAAIFSPTFPYHWNLMILATTINAFLMRWIPLYWDTCLKLKVPSTAWNSTKLHRLIALYSCID